MLEDSLTIGSDYKINKHWVGFWALLRMEIEGGVVAS